MSQFLHGAAESAATVPLAIHLDLKVEDHDTIHELLQHTEGEPRDQFALEAIKIGVLALRRASSTFDAEFIKRETDRMLITMRRQLDDHARAAHERVAGSLKEYFDPESGRFNQRVKHLISDDGDLASLMRGLFDGDDSRLARTMLNHVGENSPLMKLLSPDQSQGLLATLRANLESQLSQQRERILREFSLDNAEGALARLVKELTGKHGDLSKELQLKIDEVVKEFSLDEENSALSRLVRNVDRAQRTITNEFSLDNEQSALRRMKNELSGLLDAHIKSNAEFQEQVKVSLAKLVTRREEQRQSTAHGLHFEDAVFEFLDREAQRQGDTAVNVGATTGNKKNCKVGDAVVELGPDHAAAGANIVIEAKEDASYTIKRAREEVELARKNRSAQHGVFVFSKRTAPSSVQPLVRYGDDVLVVWDADDPQTDAYFKGAMEIARALCRRQAADSATESIDWEPVDRALLDIEKRAQNLEQIRNSATTIKSSSDKILKRVDLDQNALLNQVELLRTVIDDVKRLQPK